MKEKKWTKRIHNATKIEEKDATTEVEANNRVGKELVGGISRGGRDQDDLGHSRTKKNTFTLQKMSKINLENFF